jgi:hypothetical protein
MILVLDFPFFLCSFFFFFHAFRSWNDISSSVVSNSSCSFSYRLFFFLSLEEKLLLSLGFLDDFSLSTSSVGLMGAFDEVSPDILILQAVKLQRWRTWL